MDWVVVFMGVAAVWMMAEDKPGWKHWLTVFGIVAFVGFAGFLGGDMP